MPNVTSDMLSDFPVVEIEATCKWFRMKKVSFIQVQILLTFRKLSKKLFQQLFPVTET